MTEHVPAKLAKWPFFLSDLVLVFLAVMIVQRSSGPLQFWEMAFCFASLSVGAWLGLIPFLREFRASVQVAEANAFSTAAAQMKNLETIKNQISQATGQWSTVQEHSTKSVQAAKELVDRMRAEAEQFCKFFEKLNETEKAHLRLEIEKLRRMEGEWLQVSVRILDHIYALTQAAARSGQPGLISQLGQFQTACRDAARKVGLVPFVAGRDESFDPKAHQLVDARTEPPPNAQIAETLATGYTYQAQLIRKALVSLRSDEQPELNLLPREKEAAPPRTAPDINADSPSVESTENAATTG